VAITAMAPINVPKLPSNSPSYINVITLLP
jgi:hypothetical protein